MIASRDSRNPKYIVGIGASAGGLEALQKLLAALPSNTGFPFIIVQHLSPDYKSLLTQILGKHTGMPVVQAEEGVEIEPDHVYIIQPGKMMTLSKGRIHYTDQIPKELNLPIDAFFRSLAEEAGPRAIAIVLSGTGSDGTNGVRAIKERDGLVLVQDLETAKFDGMPRSVIRTGLADAQISPEEMALELEHIAGDAVNTGRSSVEDEANAAMMKRVYSILNSASKVNFTLYKRGTIVRRMERRMMLTHRESLQDYIDLLCESPEEARTLSKDILIGVTSFFRDPEHFNILNEKVVSAILSRSTPDEPIRVWVAGCSTGEEAYSIAILFHETMEEMAIKREVKIFATDLDVMSIETAGKGVFGENIIDSVSPARLSRNFTRRNGTYTINRAIRKMIVFSPHNVFQDPPFGQLDLISCRNLLIYFQPVLQNNLFAIFHQSLKDGGFLFLGSSEGTGAFSEAFPPLDCEAKIYAHRRNVRTQGSGKTPFVQPMGQNEGAERSFVGGSAREAPRRESGRPAPDAISTSLLQRFIPPSIVVNDKNEFVHSFGNITNLAHLSVGQFSRNLYDLLTDGLKIPVSTLLKEARAKKAEVQYTDVHFTGELNSAVIDLTAMPVTAGNRGENGLFALVFAQTGQQRERAVDSAVFEVDRAASRRITDLEQELAGLQGELNRSIAEQECVTEELQAANEELLTANEELQSSNEELQSVNEELYTVNSEYQQKLSELNDLNDDIANFLSSTLTGIIFVDTNLNIRRYTNYVTSEFSVMDHDIGRSLAFVSYHFPSIDITEICTNVLKTLVPDEREVATSEGKMFFMRVAPYRSTENKITGCVITLVDITSQKQGLRTLQSTEKQLTMARQASDAKSDYLTRIAHEIHTPMSSLIMLAKRAKMQSLNREALNADLDKIADTVNYMTGIVTDLSEASVSERLAGGQVIECFGLRDVLDSVATMMEPKMREARATLKVYTDDDLNPLYVGNKTKLRQIVISFLNNSAKRVRAGGVIALRAFEQPTDTEKARLCIQISSAGAEVGGERVPGMFRPLTRESILEDNEANSMELGLSIANNLITSMEGGVSVAPDEGNGSSYLIYVMLDRFIEGEDGSEDKYLLPAAKEFDLSGCNVLIAEDNALNRTILEAMLSDENMTFIETADGEEALKAFVEAPEHTFACILMDMRMPRLDGIRATAAIRASGKADCKTIPIIGVSANGFAEDIRKARMAGIDEYITKPIDRDRLFGAMAELIKSRL